MNFQQLRSVREAVRRGFNLTDVAAALFTSQPGVSRQIRELEDELGVEIFERGGKRLTGLTAPGRQLLGTIERLLLEAENLKRAALEFASESEGKLVIATTHTQARYALPTVVAGFTKSYPRVALRLHQSPPQHIVDLLIDGEADVGIATEALEGYPELATFPAYRWNHLVVAPRGHEILRIERPTLEDLARHPLITYDPGFTGRPHIDRAFAAAGMAPDFVLTALDADVIKTYVEGGLGLGILASMAFDRDRDRGLGAVDASHLFAANLTRIAIRRGAYLRNYVHHFIELFAPHVGRELVERAASGEAITDQHFPAVPTRDHAAFAHAHA